MTSFSRRLADQLKTNRRIAVIALIAGAAVACPIAHASAFESAGRHGSAGSYGHENAPFGANVIGRGIAGQHDRFRANEAGRFSSEDETTTFTRGSLRLR